MDNQKNLVLHIGGEVFLFTTPHLTRKQLIDIESLAEAAIDDYTDEIEGMNVYKLCEWFQSKVGEFYQIELQNAAIHYEVRMKAAR